jgi:signal peptidase I
MASFRHSNLLTKSLIQTTRLTGDRLEIRQGHLVVNGIIQTQQPFDKITYSNYPAYGAEGRAISVPDDAYFVLGDNSPVSNDSRVWGFLPKKSILGKVYKIFWPANRMNLPIYPHTDSESSRE